MKDYPIIGRNQSQKLVRKKLESDKKSTGKLIITWVILVMFAMFFVQQRLDFIQTERRVRKLLIEKRKILSSILPLKLEERYLTQLTKVERTAKKKFYLRKPKEKQIIKFVVKDSNELR